MVYRGTWLLVGTPIRPCSPCNPEEHGRFADRLPPALRQEGEEPAPVEDEKTVVRRVEQAKAEQLSRPAYKPPPDHPWRRPFKPEATGVAAG